MNMELCKKYYELDREECTAVINEIISKTEDLWILRQIYRFAVNITKEETA